MAADLGQTAATSSVLDMIGQGDFDMAVAAGDLSYGATGGEQDWCDFVKARTGEGFPFELLAGNHESNGQNGHINDFGSCLPNQLPGAVGTYGRQYYVDVPQVQPLVRFVMIGANLTFPDGWYDYRKGSPRYVWTAAAIDGARSAGIPWVVLTTHYNCLGIGNYDCPLGRDIVDLAMDKRVDLVLTGHDHLYGRTHMLGTGAACPTATEGYDADCVLDSGADGVYDTADGTILATVGTGGRSVYPVNPSSPNLSYYKAYSGMVGAPEYGLLDLTIDADGLNGRFRTVTGAETDQFTIRAELSGPTAPQPPTDFTATVISGPAVDLSWVHAGADVAEFDLFRDGAALATVPADARNYSDAAVAAGFSYDYRLVARGVNGLSSDPALVSASVPIAEQLVLVPAESEWSYRFTNQSAPPPGWEDPAFDDSSWPSGSAPLGFGSSHIATNVDVAGTETRPLSAQFRRDFMIADPGLLPPVQVTTHANDGVVVLVNGVEVGRGNLPSGPISWTTYATAAPPTSYAISHSLTFAVPHSVLRAGVNTVSVQAHLNYRRTASISMDLEMRTVTN